MGKASNRHKVSLEMPELNLNSMMDLFAVLIPALLMMSAVVEVTTLNVSAPAIGGSDTPPPVPEKPPLNLTLTITEHGYLVAGAGGVLSGPGATVGPAAAGQPPNIPVAQSTTGCSRFRGSWPPPRKRNRSEPACQRADEQRSFWTYNNPALTKRVMEIKDAYPDERRIIIQAEPDVEYESIIDAMDATRDVRDPGGDLRILFDEVILSPGQF